MSDFDLPVDYRSLTWRERIAVREQYVREQDGWCFYCGKFLYEDPPSEIDDAYIDWSKFPRNFLEYPVHLQHNHSSGMTEGAVHAYCNAYMWMYEGQ